MTIVEPADSSQPILIPIDQFAVCLVDGKTRKEIAALYPTRAQGAYYLDKLDRYLQDHHGMDIKTYVIRYGGVLWPKCPVTGKDVGYRTACGKGLVIRRIAMNAGLTKEQCPAFRAACERMSVDRQGKGNPMYGQAAWNKGLRPEDHPSAARMAEAARGRLHSDETKQTMRKRRAESPKKARHTTPHSPETVAKMRLITATRWATGGFSNGPTGIEKAMRAFLQSQPTAEPFVEQCQEGHYVLDFAFKAAKVAIECDGDYFHINPTFYPNGPKDVIQRRNAGRDKAKNAFLAARGWTVIRIWECDINAGSYKEPLICKLKASGLLSP